MSKGSEFSLIISLQAFLKYREYDVEISHDYVFLNLFSFDLIMADPYFAEGITLLILRTSSKRFQQSSMEAKQTFKMSPRLWTGFSISDIKINPLISSKLVQVSVFWKTGVLEGGH